MFELIGEVAGDLLMQIASRAAISKAPSWTESGATLTNVVVTNEVAM